MEQPRVEVLNDAQPAVTQPAVTPQQPSDNIAAAQPNDANTQTAASQPPTPPEFYNLAVALRMISNHYERDFPKMRFNTPAQITDGAVVEFVDTSMDVTVATARVRVRNMLNVNNSTGDMSMVVHLSDMTYTKTGVNVSVARN